MLRVLVILLVSSFLGNSVTNAQSPTALVGTWKRLVTSGGRGAERAVEGVYLLYNPDGFYAVLILPADRTPIRQPFETATKEQFVAAFRGTLADYGKYSVTADTVSQAPVASLSMAETYDPTFRQKRLVFRVAGDTLWVDFVGGNNPERFQRAM